MLISSGENAAVISVPPMQRARQRGARWCGRVVPPDTAGPAGELPGGGHRQVGLERIPETNPSRTRNRVRRQGAPRSRIRLCDAAPTRLTKRGTLPLVSEVCWARSASVRSQNPGTAERGSRNPSQNIAVTCSFVVGVAGFEPAASSSRTKRAAKLRYTPPARDLSGAVRDSDSLAETPARSGTPAEPPGQG